MIEFVPFCTAIVDIGPNLAIGTGPAGDRSIGEIRAVTVEGERLRGTLAGSAAADWITRTGAIGVIDVRMAIRTDDGALIFVAANALLAVLCYLLVVGEIRRVVLRVD